MRTVADAWIWTDCITLPSASLDQMVMIDKHDAPNHLRPRLQNVAVGFAAAAEGLRAGRLREAQTILREILSSDSRHYQSLHHLGLIEHRIGQNERALDFFRHALAIRPDYAESPPCR